MAQFTLYRNTNRQTQTRYPFLLDVQNDFLDVLKTRLVIPAIKLAEQKPITRLNPVFEYEQQQYLLAVQEMPPSRQATLASRLQSWKHCITRYWQRLIY